MAQTRGFGHARDASGRVVIREGTFPVEENYYTFTVDPLCPCKQAWRDDRMAVMCFACSGPTKSYFHHHSASDTDDHSGAEPARTRTNRWPVYAEDVQAIREIERRHGLRSY